MRFNSEQEILDRIVELRLEKLSFEVAASIHDEVAEFMFKLIDSHRERFAQHILDETVLQAKRHRVSADKIRARAKMVERELLKLKDALSAFRTGLLPGIEGDGSVVVE